MFRCSFPSQTVFLRLTRRLQLFAEKSLRGFDAGSVAQTLCKSKGTTWGLNWALRCRPEQGLGVSPDRQYEPTYQASSEPVRNFVLADRQPPNENPASTNRGAHACRPQQLMNVPRNYPSGSREGTRIARAHIGPVIPACFCALRDFSLYRFPFQFGAARRLANDCWGTV